MEKMTKKELVSKISKISGKKYMWHSDNGRVSNVSALIDKVVTNITVPEEDYEQDMILFECADGSAFLMHHMQDCCENVEIEDINGDLDNLIGTPIVMATEAHSEKEAGEEFYEHQTWTFYKFATVKGYVDIRWCGTSNGYYSEAVDFAKLR